MTLSTTVVTSNTNYFDQYLTLTVPASLIRQGDVLRDGLFPAQVVEVMHESKSGVVSIKSLNSQTSVDVEDDREPSYRVTGFSEWEPVLINRLSNAVHDSRYQR